MDTDLIRVLCITAICCALLGGVAGYALGWNHGYWAEEDEEEEEPAPPVVDRTSTYTCPCGFGCDTVAEIDLHAEVCDAIRNRADTLVEQLRELAARIDAHAATCAELVSKAQRNAAQRARQDTHDML